jgi:hypothetical protein
LPTTQSIGALGPKQALRGRAEIVAGTNWDELYDSDAVDKAIQEIVDAARK